MTKITESTLMDKALAICELAELHGDDDIGELSAELYQEIGQYAHKIHELIDKLSDKLTIAGEALGD